MKEKVLNLQADHEKQGHVVESASSVLSLDLKALREINPVSFQSFCNIFNARAAEPKAFLPKFSTRNRKQHVIFL